MGPILLSLLQFSNTKLPLCQHKIYFGNSSKKPWSTRFDVAFGKEENLEEKENFDAERKESRGAKDTM